MIERTGRTEAIVAVVVVVHGVATGQFLPVSSSLRSSICKTSFQSVKRLSNMDKMDFPMYYRP